MAHVQFRNKIASKKKKDKTSNGRRRKNERKIYQNVCLGLFLETRLEHQHSNNMFVTTYVFENPQTQIL